MVEKVFREVLQVLRPNERFTLDISQARSVISSFNDFLAKQLEAPTEEAIATVTVTGPGEPILRRFGYSNMDSQDLNLLFLYNIHAPLDKLRRSGDEISSFFVKQSRHKAFFGMVKVSEKQQDYSEFSTRIPTEPQDQPPTIINNPTENNISTPGLPQSQNIYHRDIWIITFQEDGDTICEVSYNKDLVNQQAKIYADEGKKLSVPGGPYFTWENCFDILERLGKSVVSVVPQRKRRRGEELPGKLQLAGHDTFATQWFSAYTREEEEL